MPSGLHPNSQANLKPFKEGYDARREHDNRGAKRIFDTPEQLELLAEAMCTGVSTKVLAETFNCSASTIKTMRKDPRIKAIQMKFIEDRVIRITRKVDTEMDKRLENVEDMDTQDLLKVRKEYLGGVLRQQATGGKADDATIGEAMQELEQNPDLATELTKLLDRGEE